MIHVLLITKDHKSSADITDQLHRHKFKVENCPSFKSGLQLIKKKKFELVLTDLFTPEKLTIELLLALKQRNAYAQMIILAEPDEVEISYTFINKGIYDIIALPVSINRLNLLVNRAISKASLLRENDQLKSQLTDSVSPGIGYLFGGGFTIREENSPLLCDLFHRMTQKTNARDVLKLGLTIIRQIVSVDICLVHLFQEPTHEFQLVLQNGQALNHDEKGLPYFNHNFPDWWKLLSEQKPIFIQKKHHNTVPHPLQRADFNEIIYLPIAYQSKIIGLITVASETSLHNSDEKQLLLLLISCCLGMTIENIQLAEQRVTQIEAIKTKNTELKSFIYRVSHDLKSPLMALYGFADLLNENYRHKLDEAGQDYLNMILINSEVMHRMIDGILELSRIGRMIGPRARFSTRRMLEEVAAIFDYQIKQKRIELKFPRKMPLIYADRERIATVFQNLISNAIKYMGNSSNRTIQINWREEQDDYLFWISDNGIGIPEQHQPHVFELFRKFNGDDTNGTGVGLTIAKKILEYHGGKIWLTSKENSGTTFYFTIPKFSRVIQA